MDKLKSVFSVNKKIFVFFVGLFIIALIFGSSLPLFLNDNDKMLICDYLKDFVNGIDSYQYLSLFLNGLCTNLAYGFFIWLLGISIIGIPIVLIMFFAKCFILGFSVSTIIINYGFKGVLFSLMYVFPHQVINVLIYGLLTCYSVIFSLQLLFLLIRKNDFNISASFKRYFKIFVFSFMILFISLLYEVFLEPIVLKFIFDLLRL